MNNKSDEKLILTECWYSYVIEDLIIKSYIWMFIFLIIGFGLGFGCAKFFF